MRASCHQLAGSSAVAPALARDACAKPMRGQAVVSGKTISLTMLLVAACAYSTVSLACFDDKKWNALQTEGPASLLYVWSPRMVLSAHNAATAQAAAAAQGLQFIAVHDSRLAATEVAQALHKLATHPEAATRASAAALQGSQPLCSPTLVERDALRHFPTAWVAGAGRARLQTTNANISASAATVAAATGARNISENAMVGAMPAYAWAISLRQRLDQP